MARVSKTCAFAFLPVSAIANEKIVLFRLDGWSSLAVLQSRVHEIWARLLSSTLKDDLQYTPTQCFETFPLPSDFEADPALEAAGKAYYEFRAELMVRNDEGLTKTYNRFHDPNETSPDILRLRELHAAMDRAVLDAYGWTDIQPTCEFLLDYEDEEANGEQGTANGEEGASSGQSPFASHHSQRRRRPWRYRWPEDIHDEVLARLLALNAARAEAERRAGLAAAAEAKKASPKRGRKRKASPKTPEIPGLMEDADDE